MHILKYLRQPGRIVLPLAMKGFFRNMDDKKYLEMVFKYILGYKLDFENPQTFNEKIQWLKVYDRNPIYTTMVDKYKAKKYVADIIGEEYIIPTLNVWNNFDEIDFETLPSSFVLKCTHDSGGLVIVKDKKNLDLAFARKKIASSMKKNYYFSWREWPYKDVETKIIAEKYIESLNGLIDYKFYCFNGEPKFLYISQGLENHNTASISFVTLDWEFASYKRSDYKPFDKLPEKPINFDKMLEISRKLSKGRSFLRVDLYEIEGKVYFSELTFSPCGGFLPFKEVDSDVEIGKFLELPIK